MDDRPLRADAERNRRRLLDAAEALFCERGLDVGVGEIAHAAGVGRGTLFRNFPSKEHLIAAIVVDRMGEAAESARSLLTAPDPGEALFAFLEEIAGRQNVDRALFEAVGDEFMSNEDIRAAYEGLVSALDDLIARAQKAGAVRDDIGSLDALMMIKGACQVATSFAHLDSQIGKRQLDLVRAALTPPAAPRALHGATPTFEDLARAFPGQTSAPADERATG